jgi:WD40 repeat protein
MGSTPPLSTEGTPTLLEATSRLDLGDAARRLCWSERELVIGTVSGRVTRFPVECISADPATARTHEVLAGEFSGAVTGLATSQGRRLVVGTDRGELWAIDTERVELLTSLPDPFSSCSPLGNRIAATAGEVLVLIEGADVRFVLSPVGPVLCATAMSVNEPGIVLGGASGLAWIPSNDDGVQHHIITPSVTALASSAHQPLVAAGDLTGCLHIVDPTTGGGVELTGYPDRIGLVTWVGKEALVAVAADDEVTVWGTGPDGVADDQPLLLVGHDEPITSLAGHPLVEIVLSADITGRVVLWDLRRGNHPAGSVSLGSSVLTMRWSETEPLAAASTAAGEVHLLRAFW